MKNFIELTDKVIGKILISVDQIAVVKIIESGSSFNTIDGSEIILKQNDLIKTLSYRVFEDYETVLNYIKFAI